MGLRAVPENEKKRYPNLPYAGLYTHQGVVDEANGIGHEHIEGRAFGPFTHQDVKWLDTFLNNRK